MTQCERGSRLRGKAILNVTTNALILNDRIGSVIQILGVGLRPTGCTDPELASEANSSTNRAGVSGHLTNHSQSQSKGDSLGHIASELAFCFIGPACHVVFHAASMNAFHTTGLSLCDKASGLILTVAIYAGKTISPPARLGYCQGNPTATKSPAVSITVSETLPQLFS